LITWNKKTPVIGRSFIINLKI